MKDKQKRKKERTWAEAARLVRRAAEGGSMGGVGGWLAEHPPLGGGRGEALPTVGGGGPPFLLERDNPPRRWVGRGPPPGRRWRLFLHVPPLNSCGGVELAGRLLPLRAAGPPPPLPHYLAASRGSGEASFMHSGELGFREGSEAPPSLPGGQWGGAFDSRGWKEPPVSRTRVAF